MSLCRWEQWLPTSYKHRAQSSGLDLWTRIAPHHNIVEYEQCWKWHLVTSQHLKCFHSRKKGDLVLQFLCRKGMEGDTWRDSNGTRTHRNILSALNMYVVCAFPWPPSGSYVPAILNNRAICLCLTHLSKHKEEIYTNTELTKTDKPVLALGRQRIAWWWSTGPILHLEKHIKHAFKEPVIKREAWGLERWILLDRFFPGLPCSKLLRLESAGGRRRRSKSKFISLWCGKLKESIS